MWVQKPTGTSRKPALMTKNPSGVNKETQRRCFLIFSGALWCAALPQGTQVQVFWSQFNFWFQITNDLTFGKIALFRKTWKILVGGHEGGGGWAGLKGLGWLDFPLLSRRRPTSTICLPLTCTNNLIRTLLWKSLRRMIFSLTVWYNGQCASSRLTF